jgi:hypothetical protein
MPDIPIEVGELLLHGDHPRSQGFNDPNKNTRPAEPNQMLLDRNKLISL